MHLVRICALGVHLCTWCTGSYKVSWFLPPLVFKSHIPGLFPVEEPRAEEPCAVASMPAAMPCNPCRPCSYAVPCNPYYYVLNATQGLRRQVEELLAVAIHIITGSMQSCIN